jgi:hypothetical protein
LLRRTSVKIFFATRQSFSESPPIALDRKESRA